MYILIFEIMQMVNVSGIDVESRSILSVFLGREVRIDFYIPKNVSDFSEMSLLLINDGHNMTELGLTGILQNLYTEDLISPLVCAAIHAGPYRKMEYGVASQADYSGLGAKAGFYSSFVLRELLPFIRDTYKMITFKERAFAGFSLGALMAMDIVFHHPEKFSKAGLFSGSFWWRSLDQEDKNYDDNLHRIIHQEIKNGNYNRGMKFFFQCGNKDETADRNNNGIIDSIDDTMDLIKELRAKGYRENDIHYMGMPEGEHNFNTWGKAFPEFLKWGWPKRKVRTQK